MAWIAPKIDWTNDDYINYADFNRIESNTKEVAAYLNSIQYAIPALTTTTTRSPASTDFISSINRIENNLETIRTNFVTPPGYGPKEVWDVEKGLDSAEVNRLELNLKLLMDYGLIVYQSFRRCGDTICGDQGGLYYGI